MAQGQAERESAPSELVERGAAQVGDLELSYLHAGSGPALMLLHGTFWSRVWIPIMPLLAEGCEMFALDFPGFGASPGRLEPDQATVPALAEVALEFARARDLGESVVVAGHDIGGAVAQQLAADGHAERLILVNSVLYDSWPVPAVERFHDERLAATISPAEFRAQRRAALDNATTRTLSESEIDDYLSPWHAENRVRSWASMAAAADARFTLELVEPLRRRAVPTLLVWGADDEFQPVHYAERFAAEMPETSLVRVPGARHIPMEDSPDLVAQSIRQFVLAPRA